MHCSILVKDDFSGPLEEVVTLPELRPVLPEIEVNEFNLCDQVDAFDNDGWWVGMVTAKIGRSLAREIRSFKKNEGKACWFMSNWTQGNIDTMIMPDEFGENIDTMIMPGEFEENVDTMIMLGEFGGNINIMMIPSESGGNIGTMMMSGESRGNIDTMLMPCESGGNINVMMMLVNPKEVMIL
ncbi:hypothetical protein BC332_19378 [Capsicum chinense]|nr:hypothetical protein BC332_19378 [Capsicum chinense]